MESLVKTAEASANTVILERLREQIPWDADHVFQAVLAVNSALLECERQKNEFVPPFMVVNSVRTSLMMGNFRDDDLIINISGGGDVSCYPHLLEVTSAFSQWDLPMHLGYTSGKGIDDPQMASTLLSHGVKEVTFTVFFN